MVAWIKLGVAIAIMISIALLGYVAQQKGLASQEMGNWVQAIGTVFAIAASGGIAVAVPMHIRDAEGRERCRQTKFHLQVVASNARSCWKEFAAVFETPNAEPPLIWGPHYRISLELEVQRAVALADQIPLHILDEDGNAALATLQLSLAQLRYLMARFEDWQPLEPVIAKGLATAVEVTMEGITEAERDIDTLVTVKWDGLWYLTHRV